MIPKYELWIIANDMICESTSYKYFDSIWVIDMEMYMMLHVRYFGFEMICYWYMKIVYISHDLKRNGKLDRYPNACNRYKNNGKWRQAQRGHEVSRRVTKGNESRPKEVMKFPARHVLTALTGLREDMLLGGHWPKKIRARTKSTRAVFRVMLEPLPNRKNEHLHINCLFYLLHVMLLL